MIGEEQLFAAFRKSDWVGVHRVLDAWGESQSGDRRRIAHWRTNALIGEGRYQDAIDFLRAHKSDYNCKSLACTRIAEALHFLGRDREAIEELKGAPMDLERSTFPGLVIDAKYVLAYLETLNGLKVENSLLDDIPSTYVHLTSSGERFSKMDLLEMISRQSDFRR
jgi:hypothetical protein